MNRVARSALALAVGFGGASAIFIASDDLERGVDGPQGPLDLFEYCESEYGSGASAVLVGATSYGWRCAHRPNGIFTTVDIDFDAACRQQYGDAAFAQTWDEAVANSWECIE